MKTLISNQRLRLSHILVGMVVLSVLLWSGSVIYLHFHYSKPVTPAKQSETVAPVGAGDQTVTEQQATPDTQPASNVSQPVSGPTSVRSTQSTTPAPNSPQTAPEPATPPSQDSWARGADPQPDMPEPTGGGH